MKLRLLGIASASLFIVLGLPPAALQGAPWSGRRVDPTQGEITRILLDAREGQGAILEEARRLNADLSELERRLGDLAAQAQRLGDGEMLACTRGLELEVLSLRGTGARVQRDLLASVAGDDDDAQRFGLTRLDILQDRARGVSMAKGECMGSWQAVYVEIGAFTPIWEGE